MKATFTLVLAALLASGSAFGQAVPSTTIDGIAAVVDEDVILRSELDRAIANITAQYAKQPDQLPPRDILEKQVLERLILVRLQVAKAEDSGIRISDAELQQAMNSVAQQNKLTLDQLRTRLAADGLSFDEFRTSLKDEVTVQRLRQRYTQQRVQVSEAEIDQAIAGQKVGGPELHLANIQINLPEGATPDIIAKGLEKINAVKTLVEAGKSDFKSAAIRFSEAQNALDGGDLGWRSYESIPPLFANVLKTMQPGQITQPVRGPSGFQIVQLIETREPTAQKVTQYKALDIMVRTSDLVSAEAARQKIQALRDRIVAGEDFGKVAKEASDDTLTRNNGGDMGWFQADQWGTSIGAQMKALADGELSPIFQSDVGYHLVKRIATREQDVTDENRRNQARELIGNRKADEEYERYLRQMRSEAYVETRLGA
jgi:peptidyl-prolyl cis-trans isomerase SurA